MEYTKSPKSVNRRMVLAGAATLPAVPALSLDTRGRVRGGQLAHLASNLRRADDLDPLARADLIADLEDLTYSERQTLRSEFHFSELVS